MTRRSHKKTRMLFGRVVLDTNVLISGVLSPKNASGQIIRLWKGGSLQLFVNQDILDEYFEVLDRFVDNVTIGRWKVWLAHPRNVSVVHTYLPRYSALRPIIHFSPQRSLSKSTI